MRTYGTVIVGHRIIARLACPNSANTPAREKLFCHQGSSQSLGALFLGNPAEQRVTGIGSAYATLFLFTVQREGVHSQVFAPECLVEFFAQRFGLGLEAFRELRFLE